MNRFNLIALDVWGNATDGFEVNDSHRTGDVIELPEGASDDQIIAALVVGGHVHDFVTGDDATIDGDEDYMLFIADAETGYPEYHLERI